MNCMYKNAIKEIADFITKNCLSVNSSLLNSKFLITGASGMIGRVLIDTLMFLNETEGLNISITALGRTLGNLQNAFSEYLSAPNLTLLCHDVNVPLTQNANFDYIIHAASNTHPVQYSTDPIGTINANVLGTLNLLEYAKNHSCKRFIFLSSVEIYGEALEGQLSFTEKDLGYIDCNTVRAGYPESKRVGESLCCAYAKEYNLDVVIPRLCRVYGPTMKKDDSKALSQFIKKAVQREDIVLKSEGKQFYSYIDVFDACLAVLVILLNGKTGEAYNVSSKKSDITLKSLAQKLASIAGTKVVFELPNETEQKGFSKATRAILDNTKLCTLGCRELFDIDSGLKLTVDLLRQGLKDD